MTQKRQGLAVMGGTFDPVHYGHLRCAAGLFTTLNAAQVRLIPARIPPHRSQPGATSDQRMQMLQLAVQEFPEVLVDGRELERSGPSYTVDTLRALRTEFPGIPLYFVLGQDAFDKLDEWYCWQNLTDFAHLVVLTRPGYPRDIPTSMSTWAKDRLVDDVTCLRVCNDGLLGFVSVVMEDISATGIRQALATQGSSDNAALQDKLPRKVIEFIAANHLYQ